MRYTWCARISIMVISPCLHIILYEMNSKTSCGGSTKIIKLLSKMFFIVITAFETVNIIDPPHDKTNKMACAPSETSDQPGHSPSLIRVFAVRMKKECVLSYPLSAQQRLIGLGGCPC